MPIFLKITLRNKVSRSLLEQRNAKFERKTVLRSPRGRPHAGRPTVGRLWAVGRGDPASQHPTPQRLSPEVPATHQTPHLPDPSGSAARGWVGLYGSHACWPPLQPPTHTLQKEIQSPLQWHPLCFLLNERAQSVKAGRLAGGTALGTHLQPQPTFPRDHTRRIPDRCSAGPTRT